MTATVPAYTEDDSKPVPTEDDVQPVANETRDRIVTGLVTVVPVLGLLLAGWQLWGNALGVNDLIVFAVMYVATGLGITVGFHRLFTHRSFKATKGVRGTLAILGSVAIEGPTSRAIRTARTSTTGTA
jgi:stearoyl-CoA desaturase (delta-9 desaturase)